MGERYRVDANNKMYRTVGYVAVPATDLRRLQRDVAEGLARQYAGSDVSPEVIAETREGRLRIKGPVEQADRLVSIVAALCNQNGANARPVVVRDIAARA